MIDWNRMNSLRNDVGVDDFDEVVTLFLQEVDEITDRLADAPDSATLGADLHSLKGCAQGLGFRAFANLCQKGEALCASGLEDAVDIPTILSTYADSRRVFLDELPTALAG